MYRLGRWLTFSQLGALVLIGYIISVGWEQLGPRKPEVGPVRRSLAAETLPAVVEDLRLARGGIRSVVLCHLGHDPSDFLTDELRSEIESAGVLDLLDRTLAEKTRNLLSLRQPVPADGAAALAVARDRGAQGVLFGTVHRYEAVPGGAALDLELTLADAASGAAVFTKRFSRELAGSALPAEVAQEQMQRLAPASRLVGWAVLVLLLPVFTIQFIRAMVRKESNGVNAFVLGIYTAADALLAWLMVGAAVSGWIPALIFLSAVTAALAYNVFVMTFALRLEA